jgi:hypothetical protein
LLGGFTKRKRKERTLIARKSFSNKIMVYCYNYFLESMLRTKLFKSKEVEKSTFHFNVNRIVGQVGQGAVYKGMLADGRIDVLPTIY